MRRARRGHRTIVASLAATILLTFVACSGERPNGRGGDMGELPPGAGPNGPVGGTVGTLATTVAILPTTVTAIATAPDESSVLVATRAGEVFRLAARRSDRWTEYVLDSEAILDLSEETSTDGERGLLDLEFSSDGAEVYVSFTATDGTVTLRSYAYTADGPIDADPHVLAEVPHPFAAHNGGGLAVADDGALFWSIGDMDVTAPPLSQQVDSHLGAVLRVVPDDAGGPAELSTVAFGLRNPWRISVDDTTGDLWIADVGESTYEEVNRVPASDLDGPPLNFGWPYFEGDLAFAPSAPADFAPTAPELQREHSSTTCAVIGGVIYRGSVGVVPAGTYVFADLCAGGLITFDPSSGKELPGRIADIPAGVTVVDRGPSGEVWAGDQEGNLVRLDPAGWSVDAGTQRGTNGAAVAGPLPLLTELCEIPGLVGALGAVRRGDPATAEAAVTASLTRLAELRRLPHPADLDPDLDTIEHMLDALTELGERTGWDTSLPEFTTFETELLAGDGAAPGFPAALERITKRVGESCPGDG